MADKNTLLEGVTVDAMYHIGLTRHEADQLIKLYKLTNPAAPQVRWESSYSEQAAAAILRDLEALARRSKFYAHPALLLTPAAHEPTEPQTLEQWCLGLLTRHGLLHSHARQILAEFKERPVNEELTPHWSAIVEPDSLLAISVWVGLRPAARDWIAANFRSLFDAR